MIGSIERKKDSTMFTLISPEYVEELEKENKELKEHLDSVVEFYETELEAKYHDYIKEKKQLKEGLHKILDLNKRAINCESQKVTIKYLLKQYDLIYETLGELQPGLMKGDKENE